MLHLYKKILNSEKTSDDLIGTINLHKDLRTLAKKHSIKRKLYDGDGLE